MTVKQVIHMLSQKDPDEQLIIGWWDKNFFECNNPITDIEWAQIVADTESSDWSSLSDALSDIVDKYHTELTE